MFSRPAPTGEVKCPSCGHKFMPPRITIITQEQLDRYGPNPVKCSKCNHIWSRGQ
jgi:hypothetical protein